MHLKCIKKHLSKNYLVERNIINQECYAKTSSLMYSSFHNKYETKIKNTEAHTNAVVLYSIKI